MALCRHNAKGFKTTQKCATQVHTDNMVPRGYIHFNKRMNDYYSRTIHNDINTPEGIHDLLKEVMHVFFVRDITYNCKHVVSAVCNLIGHFVQRSCGPAEEYNLCTFTCKAMSSGTSYAAPGTR